MHHQITLVVSSIKLYRNQNIPDRTFLVVGCLSSWFLSFWWNFLKRAFMVQPYLVEMAWYNLIRLLVIHGQSGSCKVVQ